MLSKLWKGFLYKHRMSEIPSPSQTDVQDQFMPAQLSITRKLLEDALGGAKDVFFRPVENSALGRRFLIIAIEGLVDKKELALHVVDPLLNAKELPNNNPDFMDAIGSSILSVPSFTTAKSINEAKTMLLEGNSLLLVDGIAGALVIQNQQYEHRTVGAPLTEQTTRGPQEGFVEALRVNTALLRRHLKDDRLRLDTMELGRRSKAKIVVAYIDGIVDPRRLEAVKEDIASLDIDAVHDVGELTIILEKRSFNIFPLAMISERTDRTSAALLEGRIAVFMENSPGAMIVPTIFLDFFRAPEDYYSAPLVSTFYRFLRMFVGAHLTMMLPAIYISLNNFPTGLIGAQLVMNMAASREGLAFPPTAEVLLMLIALDIILEASLRLPKLVSGAATIVGGLILGQAAVQAKLASNIIVIVVAVTAITNLTITNIAMIPAMRLLKYYFVLWAHFLGLPGVIFGATTVLAYVGSLTSYGVPYLSQMSSFHLRDIFDNIYVFSPKWRTHRPRTFHGMDGQRWDTKTMKYNEDSLDDI